MAFHFPFLGLEPRAVLCLNLDSITWAPLSQALQMIPRQDAGCFRLAVCQPAQSGLALNKDDPTVDTSIFDRPYEADISTPRLEELPP